MSVFFYLFLVIAIMFFFGYMYDKRRKNNRHYDERFNSNQINSLSEQYNSESIDRMNKNGSGGDAN